jgi:hypothetical protein
MEHIPMTAQELSMLAEDLRIAFVSDAKVESRTRLEWTDSKMAVIALLVKARNAFADNEAFGIWLERNGLDRLSKDDRSAAISLGEHLELCRAVLLDSDSISLRLIWDKNRWRYEGRAKVSLRTAANTKYDENATPDGSTEPNTPSGKHDSPMAKRFGYDLADALVRHYGRKTRTTSRIAQKLTRQQGRRLVEFIRATPDLPEPANSDNDLGLPTLWAKAPLALVNRFRLGRSEADALMLVLDQWEAEIVPVLTQWRGAGEPANASAWYARVVPPQAAAVAEAAWKAEAEANITKTVTALVEDANDNKPRFDPTCRAAFKGPIRHFGAQIWPAPPGYAYSFDDAWYVATIWRKVDASMARAIESPKTRAAQHMKVLIGCFRNLRPEAGDILALMLWAQDRNPHLTSEADNVCPPYDSIQ